MGFVGAGDLAAGKSIADPAVEINSLGEGRPESIGHLLRHLGINIATPGRELDPQLAGGMIIYEAPDHGRRHGRSTFEREGRSEKRQAASGVGTVERLRLIAPAIPPSASKAPATVSEVH